jgi:hypothetical protein
MKRPGRLRTRVAGVAIDLALPVPRPSSLPPVTTKTAPRVAAEIAHAYAASVVAGIGWRHVPLPQPPDGLMPATQAACEAWMTSWIAAHWTPAAYRVRASSSACTTRWNVASYSG